MIKVDYCIFKLPVYGNPYPPQDLIIADQRGFVENGIYQARTALKEKFKFMDGFLVRSKQIVETAKAHTMTTVDYISDEGNTVPKAIAITGGGLVGLIISSRRGFIRKLLYTSGGVATMAGICYPKQTRESLEVTGYIIKNKAVPFIKDYTGIDLQKYLSKGLDDLENSKKENIVTGKDKNVKPN